ncbi:tyrosine-type recombinase/integrase [Trujillonella endophytica]|uniref:Phage integrase family protein n=1 Tax=Trujillonella endophytica TaxID=673521 RepID=A0A1H8WQC1_9ACTN|nr:tyrosine-type recombinase/integrase [Trujillella endophytica]SEP29637.1 Phage integrase family protein [Trujillella endophytica]
MPVATPPAGHDHPVYVRALERLTAVRAPGFARHLLARWRAWVLFADHHALDPREPADADLVAFAHARALVGVGYGTIAGTLGVVDLVLGDERLTRAARRHLADLHGEGLFGPGVQAPVLTLGEVLALVAAAPDALTRLLVVLTYRAALRPREWTGIRWPEHVGVTADGVRLVIAGDKTGPGRVIDLGTSRSPELSVERALAAALAERGRDPGPLAGDEHGPLHYAQVDRRLRLAAAAAGVPAFTSYSLRRSWAVHANLTGTSARVIRVRLGHRPGTATYRRYIEPLLALQVAQGVDPKTIWLATSRPAAPPVPLEAVGNPAIDRTQRYAFAAGTLDELLADIDLPGLRVHPALANLARSTIDAGHAVRRRWAAWAQQQVIDPFAPDAWALSEWVDARLTEVSPVTAAADLARLRLAWIDATGAARIPGYDTAADVAAGALRLHVEQQAPGKKSRLADATDRQLVCAAALAAVPGPSMRWAVRALALATRARRSVEVLEVTDDAATVRVDGRRTVPVTPGAAGVLCPVAAAEVAAGAGELLVPRGVNEHAVLAAAAPHTAALRDALAVMLLAGSGARPSDLARARAAAVNVQPGGVAVVLAASKGRKPGIVPRPRVVWAPDRDGACDPVAAWEAWSTWWAPGNGPLLPRDIQSCGGLRGLDAAAVSRTVRRAADAAGLLDLNAYGFRYGRATEMHVAGYDLETIAEALGHARLGTARGYVFDFDPDADGWSGRVAGWIGAALDAAQARGVLEQEESA